MPEGHEPVSQRTPNKEKTGPPPKLSTLMALIFYGVLLVLAWLLGSWWLGLDLVEWHDRYDSSLWLDAGLGLGLGLISVWATRILERTTTWARELGREFKSILGRLTPGQVLVFAVASGVVEEVFFRGFLQQALSELAFGSDLWGLLVAALIFGLIHVGPDRKKFLPWTIMALVWGLLFGLLYWYTGNILGPVIAHFTINFFNLLHITQSDAFEESVPDSDQRES